MELQSIVWSYFWFKKEETLCVWPWRKMWKDTENLILFKISSGEWGMINLLHIYLEWFICSNTQAFLFENTLKYYLVNKWETHLEPLWKQKLGNITLAFSDACTNLLSLWKPSVNYILKSWDFPTFGKFLECKRWLQEKLFTSIPWESSGHKRSWKLIGGALLFLDFFWSYSQGRPVAVLGWEVNWSSSISSNLVFLSGAQRGAVQWLCWHLNPAFLPHDCLADCSIHTIFNPASYCDLCNLIKFMSSWQLLLKPNFQKQWSLHPYFKKYIPHDPGLLHNLKTMI